MPEQRQKPVRGKDVWRRRARAMARRYRTGIDRELLEYLKKFVRHGTPEEKRLMYDVMVDRESTRHGFCQPEEIPLLASYEHVIGEKFDGHVVFRASNEEYYDFVDYLRWLKDNRKALAGGKAVA